MKGNPLSLSLLVIIIQLLTNEALDMMCYYIQSNEIQENID